MKIYLPIVSKTNWIFNTTSRVLLWLGLDALIKKTRLLENEERELRQGYNDAVYYFNRHPSFSLHRELTIMRYSIQFEIDRLNSILAVPYQFAQQKDQRKQKQDFLAGFLIASKGLGLAPNKKKLLIELGILTLEDFDRFSGGIKGIGGRSLSLIYHHINEVSKDFNYHPDNTFIEAQIVQIKEVAPLRKSSLTAQLSTIEAKIASVCKELHEANDEIDQVFDAKVAPLRKPKES